MKKLLALVFFSGTFIAAYAQQQGVNNNQQQFVNKLETTTPEAPSGSVEGYVRTADNQPAADVTVILQGTSKATLTDVNGHFILKNVRPGNYILEVSMIGLQMQQKPVTVQVDDPTLANLTLTEDIKKLSDVIVTARKSQNEKITEIGKIPVAAKDLPQSFSVIGQGVIRDQQALRMGDIIKNVNGVYVTSTRGAVQESFAARGYGFSSTNMFKNGFRVNSGVMPEVSGLEKVEVLKGSAAILYGQVAPGGIVNMVTKQPKFKFGGEVAMQAGSYDLYKPSFDVYGPASSAIAYRINGTFESADSYRDVIHSERYYVNPSLLFKLGKRTELLVEGDYLKHDFTPDFGIGSLDDTLIPHVPRSRFMGTAWSYSHTQQATGTASLKHLFSDNWRMEAAISYQRYSRDYFSTERIQADADGEWVRPLGRIDTKEDYYATQVNFIGQFKTGKLQHTLLTGADADRDIIGNYDFNFAEVAGLPAKSYDKINILEPGKYVQRTDIPDADRIRKREAPVNRFGAYVQDLVKISPKFNVLAGVRWSYVQTLGIDSTDLLTNKQTKGNAKSDQAFSPRFGLVYKPLTTTSVFASYSNSFQTNSGSDIYGNSLTPSIIDQYEIGVKNDFFNGNLSANVTLYRIKNNNLAQIAEFKADGTPNSDPNLKMLAGETTSDGVEVDIAGQPVNGLSVMAGYSYNYMRYTKTPDADGNYVEGERLVNNPAHTANASIFYTFQNTGLKGFKIGAAAFYIGDRFGGWNNKKVLDPSEPTASRLIAVKGYTTVDITAGYSFKNIALLAKVSNVTNTLNYYVHENYSINPIPPRQFVAMVSYKF
ncbi:TonB-dependent receptor [Ilyomonas limi]|uniref:TonB-dependent receptor n=1 Tax=Ilyomonas limi TaxID=2575867 RepID=UPI001F0EA262|nr:TonB-dependent receptor [Ilyomonas limi]